MLQFRNSCELSLIKSSIPKVNTNTVNNKWAEFRPEYLWTGSQRSILTTGTGNHWSTENETVKKKVGQIYDERVKTGQWREGVLFTLDDISENPLTLHLGTCNFLDCKAANVSDIRDDIDEKDKTKAIMLATMIITTDNKFVLGLRTPQTSQSGVDTEVSFIGGMFNKDEMGTSLDPFLMIRKEIEEELGIDADTTEITLAAVTMVKQFCLPSLFFVTKISHDMNALRARFSEKGNKDEHTQIIGVGNSVSGIDDLVNSGKYEFNVSGKVGVMVYLDYLAKVSSC